MGSSFKKGPAKWLLDELPQLQEAGVLDAASAGKLQEHYARLIGEVPAQSRKMAVLMLSVLGSLLIGAGIAALLAHNWDELSKGARLAVAFLPLIAVQCLGGWVLWKEKPLSWRECVGTLTPLAVIGVISIVAQVYNISGDPVKFYFTVCLLSLPVMYIYRSTMTGILCMVLVCVLGYELFNGYSGEKAELWKYWICAGGLVPFVVFMFLRHGQTMRAFWLAIGCVVLLIFQSCYALDRFEMLSMPIFGMLASALWLLGQSEYKNRWALAFKSLAMPGMLLIFIIGSISGVWDLWRYHSDKLFYTKMPLWWHGFMFALLASNVLLLVRTARRKDWLAFLPGLTGIVLLLTMILCCIYDFRLSGEEYWRHESASLVTSLAGFFGGVAVMLLAIRQEKMLEMNFGMLVAAAMLVFRFFYSEYSFTVKGVAFIIIGVLFLAINWVMASRFRRMAK